MAIRSLIKPGDKIAGFTMLSKIGQGSPVGEVWEAWETKAQRKVALKFFSSPILSDSQALLSLSHPHVCAVYNCAQHEDTPYLVMEYIDGLPLDHFLMSHPCGLKDTLIFSLQLADGLAAAHAAGLVHRDLRPSNVIIDVHLSARLIDFGIAMRREEQHASDEMAMIGMTNYVAPEVASGRAATSASDIYSLGLVIYHMLTGEMPFQGRTPLETLEKIRTSSLAFSPRLQTLLPDSLKRLIAKMTAKVPGQRHADMQEVIADLKRVDLNEWPEDLRSTGRRRWPVSNFTEVRKMCEVEGFDVSEQRFIINLAARLQTEASAAMELASSTEPRPLLRIRSATLQEAIRRYEEAKSWLAARRVEETPVVARSLSHSRKRVLSWPATLVVAFLLFAIFFAFLTLNP
ncbi:MAG: serine/threonine protein kinase [Bdellovibrionales bacterium]|nr:serine/threonine protein kinase [Bdellovibrionales bacterium]